MDIILTIFLALAVVGYCIYQDEKRHRYYND